ncbi:MAG: hypothetical protein KDK74_15875, partial [Cephaloticoccus sp.]|nr:hypothetical protein [Cephaloticoccus sp.]
MHAEKSFGLGTDEVRRRHIIVKAVLVGLVAGLIGSAFRLSLEWIEHARHEVVHNFSGWISLPVAIALGAVGGGL